MFLVLIFSILDFCDLFAFSLEAHGIKMNINKPLGFFKLLVDANINSLSKKGIHIHNVIFCWNHSFVFCE